MQPALSNMVIHLHVHILSQVEYNANIKCKFYLLVNYCRELTVRKKVQTQGWIRHAISDTPCSVSNMNFLRTLDFYIIWSKVLPDGINRFRVLEVQNFFDTLMVRLPYGV